MKYGKTQLSPRNVVFNYCKTNSMQILQRFRPRSALDISMEILNGKDIMWWMDPVLNLAHVDNEVLCDNAWYYYKLFLAKEKQIYPTINECRRMFDIVNNIYSFNTASEHHFHGTSFQYAHNITSQGINLKYSKPIGDFHVNRQGFYMTSSKSFAIDWASNNSSNSQPSVVTFHVSKKELDNLQVYVISDYDEWCEVVIGGNQDGHVNLKKNVDIIVGPLLLNNIFIKNGNSSIPEVGIGLIPFVQQTALVSSQAVDLFNLSKKEYELIDTVNREIDYLLDFDKYTKLDNPI